MHTIDNFKFSIWIYSFPRDRLPSAVLKLDKRAIIDFDDQAGDNDDVKAKKASDKFNMTDEW